MEAPRRPSFSVGVFSQCMKGQRIHYQQTGEFHFLTFSSFRRQPYLSTVAAMELFEDALERVRLRYLFAVAGYVVMPEHVHLLVNEPGWPLRRHRDLRAGAPAWQESCPIRTGKASL